MDKVVIIGDGGHAKVVIDKLHSMHNFEIVGMTNAVSAETQ